MSRAPIPRRLPRPRPRPGGGSPPPIFQQQFELLAGIEQISTLLANVVREAGGGNAGIPARVEPTKCIVFGFSVSSNVSWTPSEDHELVAVSGGSQTGVVGFASIPFSQITSATGLANPSILAVWNATAGSLIVGINSVLPAERPVYVNLSGQGFMSIYVRKLTHVT